MQIAQIATVLYENKFKPIPVPCRWGEYTVMAIKDTYLNGYPAKLLTLSKWNIQGIPEFPLPDKHCDESGQWVLPCI